jgi:transcriptional regulator with XRE-family HTH domain
MRYNRKRLVKARREADISVEDLAKRLDVVPLTILNWESGKSQPDAGKLGRIASITGKSLDFFFTPRQRCGSPVKPADEQAVTA